MASRLIKSLQNAFSLENVSDDLIATCAARVALRCSKVDLTAYRRKPGQAALEVAAREAIVGAFRDHYPGKAHKFLINGHWPYAHATIRGNRAWIEISIGIDYEDPDEGLDVIEIQVDRHPKQISIREKIEDALFNREPRTKAKDAPPLELVTKAAPKAREPAPVGKPIDPPNKLNTRATGAQPASKPVLSDFSPVASAKPVPTRQVPKAAEKPGAGKLRGK